MIKKEIGRLSLDNLSLIEYETSHYGDKSKFFIQLGIAGFYLSEDELKKMHALLSHYYILEYQENINIKIQEENL